MIDYKKALASVKKIRQVPEQMGTGFDEWLNALGGPSNPPFSANTSFSGEWPRFFRLLSISVGLTAAVLGIDTFVLPHDLHQSPKLPVSLAFKIIGILALIAFLYVFYSRIFGIRIKPRQSFFCWAFILIPFAPILAAIKLSTHYLGFIFLYVAMNALVIYVVVMMVKAIQAVTSASIFRTTLSVIFGIVIVVLSAIFFLPPPAAPK